MSYERAFDGGDRAVTQLDWTEEQRQDLVHDLFRRERAAAATE
jgi:hypothetical protein